MAQKNPNILTASEIAAYHYCAESWRLGHVLRKPHTRVAVERMDYGTKQHEHFQVVEKTTSQTMSTSGLVMIIAFAVVVLALLVVGFQWLQ